MWLILRSVFVLDNKIKYNRIHPSIIIHVATLCMRCVAVVFIMYIWPKWVHVHVYARLHQGGVIEGVETCFNLCKGMREF